MDFDELLNKYLLLKEENLILRKTIERLKYLPPSDFTNKDLSSWNEAVEQLKTANIHLIFKSNIHQKFAIFDQKIVWYGSINLLSYGSAEESIMRIESTKIAYELIGSLERK